MARPGQQLQQPAGVFGFPQFLQQFRVAEQFSHLRQQLEVILAAVLGYGQTEQQVDRFAVDGVEGQRLLQAYEGGLDVLAALDPAVRNRDALAESFIRNQSLPPALR